jgi:shikimate kinase
MPRLTLIGYRGTGKSTVAALVAERLGCGWVDADAVLEEKLGCTIATLVRERGEPVFRDAEATVLEDLLARQDGVLATGGGVVLRPGNREALSSHGRPVVWLTATAATIRERLAADPTTASRRPALATAAGGQPTEDPLVEVDAALAAREPLYRGCADAIFDTSHGSPESVAMKIIAWLESGEAPGPSHAAGGMPS